MEVFWTVFGTVISGVLVYILGEVVKERWLEPARHYREVKGEIAFSLSFYAYVFSNVIDLKGAGEKEVEERRQVSDKIRSLSCSLASIAEMRYRFSFTIPQASVLCDVSRDLMRLSNSLFCPYGMPIEAPQQSMDNHTVAEGIKEKLSLKR